MTDLTPATRIRAAESVVREQRAEHVGTEVVVRSAGDDPDRARFEDFVQADDYRDVSFELGRLQRAVMGEPERDGRS